VVLKEAFDEAEPRSLSQLWFDRRVRVQWYTLWVAVLVFVLTIFFGLVQSVEGALQVYLAFRSGKE
jgi:ABC-type Fe3+ transport system permease subunit